MHHDFLYPPRAGRAKLRYVVGLLQKLVYHRCSAKPGKRSISGRKVITVTTPGEFFLECLFHLKDQVPSEQLTMDYIRATAAHSEAELVNLTLKSLKDFARTTGKRLLVIVENFHTILNEQIQDSNSTRAKRFD